MELDTIHAKEDEISKWLDNITNNETEEIFNFLTEEKKNFVEKHNSTTHHKIILHNNVNTLVPSDNDSSDTETTVYTTNSTTSSTDQSHTMINQSHMTTKVLVKPSQKQTCFLGKEVMKPKPESL